MQITKRFIKTFTDVAGVAQASLSKTDHRQKSKTFKSGELGGHSSLVRNQSNGPSTTVESCWQCGTLHRLAERSNLHRGTKS